MLPWSAARDGPLVRRAFRRRARSPSGGATPIPAAPSRRCPGSAPARCALSGGGQGRLRLSGGPAALSGTGRGVPSALPRAGPRPFRGEGQRRSFLTAGAVRDGPCAAAGGAPGQKRTPPLSEVRRGAAPKRVCGSCCVCWKVQRSGLQGVSASTLMWWPL